MTSASRTAHLFRMTFLWLACAAAALPAVASPSPSAAQADRVVAIGDVHGAYDDLVAILTEVGLVDGSVHWSGGTATLVQLGDVLDRGADVRRVMDLLMRLQREAEAAGGRVVCLLGNHETMNLLGILRDVNPEAFDAFAEKGSRGRRRDAFDEWVATADRQAEIFGSPRPEPSSELEQAWLANFPPGAIEYLLALGPHGSYGAWLRGHPAAYRAGDTLFIHGGVGPALAGLDVDSLNARVAAELERFDRLRATLVDTGLVLPFASIGDVVQVARRARAAADEGNAELTGLADQLDAIRDANRWLLVEEGGPFWFRGAAKWDEVEHAEEMRALLSSFGATRVVVGHTVQRTAEITSRFDGQVLLIDTGMLSSHYTGGRPSALEITPEAISAVYLDGREVIASTATAAPRSADTSSSPALPAAWVDPDDNPLPFQTHAEVEEFLRTAQVVSISDVGTGITKPKKLLLELDGVRAHAIFKDIDYRKRGVHRTHGATMLDFRDYHLFEAAAYRLDRLLGLDRVPPAVPRTVNGKHGTVQLWIEHTIMDKERRDRGLEPPNPARWSQQRQLMHLFDNVVGNADANLGNLLIDRDWRLWFIDHTRSFVTSKSLFKENSITHCERGMWRALNELDAEDLHRELAPYLSEHEIDAVLARRDAVVARLDQEIDRNGEAAVIFDLLPSSGEHGSW